MLRDILAQADRELHAWLREKNFEAKKLKPGERAILKVETVGPHNESRFDRGALPRGIGKMGDDVGNVKHLDSVNQMKQMGRDGKIKITQTSTYLGAEDVNGAYYLNLKDKVKQIQDLRALLGDIAAELLAGYFEIKQQRPDGESIMLLGQPDDPGARSARRTRLGLDGFTIGQNRGRPGGQ